MALADEIEVGTPRQTIIHFPNGEFDDITSGIHMGTTKLSKALCENGTNVMFGGCVASQFECVLESTENFTNVEIEVYQSIGEFNQPLFVGLVDSCELQSDRLSIKIVAYDTFYNLSSKSVSDWYSNLSFPISFGDMFISLLDYVGLEPSNSLQITQEFDVYETLYGEIKFLDIIRNMCELCGGFGVINSVGKFDIIYLSKTASSPLIVLSGFNLEKYEVKAIDRVKIKSDKTDVGGSFGTGSNIYSVVGNFLCYGKTSQELNDIAEVLYDEISGRTWRPFRASLPISSPNVGCDGLVYNIRTPQGDNFNSYIFSTEFSGTQLFDQNIESFGGEYREEVSTTQEQDLTILKMRSFGLESSVEGLKGTVTQVEQQQGVLNESVAELNLGVEGLNIKVENLEKQIGGETKFYETNEPPTFENYPANTWYPDIYYPPDSDATAEDYMFPGNYTWEFIKAEYTKYLGSFIYDSSHNVLYRFILNDLNEFDFEIVEDSETGYILQSLNNLKIESNLLSSELSTQRVIVEDNQLKIIEQGTRIEQTDEYIKNEVVKNDEVIASINASQEGVAIKGKKISLEGLVTANKNFAIDEEGSMSCKDAHVSGHVEATSGKIGGWNIGEKIYTENPNAFIYPGYEEAELVRNYIFETGTLTDEQKIMSDFTCDGKVNVQDSLVLRKLIEREWTIQQVVNKYGYSPRLSNLEIEINPLDPEKIIRTTAKNAWGRDIDYYLGINGIKTNKVEADSVIGGYVKTKSGADLDTLNSNLTNRGYSKTIAQNIPKNTTTTVNVENLNNFKYILARIVTSGGAVPVMIPRELALYDNLEYANSFHSTSGNLISISIRAISNTQIQVWGDCTGYSFTEIEVFGVL